MYTRIIHVTYIHKFIHTRHMESTESRRSASFHFLRNVLIDRSQTGFPFSPDRDTGPSNNLPGTDKANGRRNERSNNARESLKRGVSRMKRKLTVIRSTRRAKVRFLSFGTAHKSFADPRISPTFTRPRNTPCVNCVAGVAARTGKGKGKKK